MTFLWNIIGRIAYMLACVVSATPALEKKHLIRNRLQGPWPQGPYLWMHGASLGECKMLLEVIRQMSQDRPQYQPILLTTQKAEILDRLRNDSADIPHTEVSIAPADTPKSMKIFMKRVKPTALVLAENELWPGYLATMKKYHGKNSVALVSGRFRRSLPFVDFSAVGFTSVQTSGDLQRLQQTAHLPTENVTVGGNWKMLPWARTGFSQPATRPQADIDDAFISIHFSEWNQVQDLLVHSVNRNESIVLFPRRLSEIEDFQKALRTKRIPTVNWPDVRKGAVSIVHEFGHTRQALTRTRFAIVGGSFRKGLGVHDFWEPLLMGVTTCIGPYSMGQEETVSRLLDHKILFRISSPDDYSHRKPLDPAQSGDFLAGERKVLLDSYQQFLNFISETNKRN